VDVVKRSADGGNMPIQAEEDDTSAHARTSKLVHAKAIVQVAYLGNHCTWRHALVYSLL
jgi:hypothetical protein